MQPIWQIIRKAILLFFDALIWIATTLFFAWSCCAVYFLEYLPPILRVILAIMFGITMLGMLIYSNDFRRSRSIIAGACFAIFIATLFVRPSNERQWAKDHAQVAEVTIKDGTATINNYRHCEYRSETDYDAKFYSKSFPLEQIESVWFIVQKFSPLEGLAHVFLSFGLVPGTDPEYFSVSVEIRREDQESYNPFRGLFRTYELTHVVGDERDLIGVRTVHRPEDRLFMYRVNATPQQAQQLFVEFANRIESLNASPQFYNSLLNNCANGITRRAYKLTPEPINWLDPRIVLPGYADSFAFEHGLIGDGSQSFEEFQQASRIDIIARETGLVDDFSQHIRGQ